MPPRRSAPSSTRDRQRAFLLGRAADGTALVGGNVPDDLTDRGCWLEPTLLPDLPADHPLLTREVFGPLAAIVRVPDLDSRRSPHIMRLTWACSARCSRGSGAAERSSTEAQAGMLSINRARPPFAAEGPFIGWKASGYGTPEHGRWNRDFYTRAQAIYGD